jgi:hypothetical protein
VYFGILRNLYDEDFYTFSKNIPEEFSTSAWWKNRGNDINALFEKYNYETETGIPGRGLLIRPDIKKS